ncbi:unnamed protein product [Rotaria sp. Silwood2]|nr:unnamed protein product [Rotaria sp. Silwood2]
MFRSLNLLSVIVLLLFYLSICVGAFNLLRRQLVSIPRAPPPLDDNPGESLFLTSYLEIGQIDLARNLSQVHLQPAYSYPSYSGYLTVNKTCGPDASSLFGLFSEHGPIRVDKDEQLYSSNITWNSKYHLLFIDQPVDTGFSFTADDRCYVHTEDEVARDLYVMLIQFFQIYYEYAMCDFYATSESYGGKYVPAIVYKIHRENPQAKLKINLKGMAIGDGLVDPYNQGDYGPAMYQMGLIDQRQLEYINLLTSLAREAIWEGQYRQAYSIFGDLFDNIYSNMTGMIDAENYLRTDFPEELFYYIPWVMASEHRRQIHVGNMTYNDGEKVQIALQDDAMQSIASKVALIANSNYKVLIYSGLLDVIIFSSVTMNWVDKLEWNYANQLRAAERVIWKVKEDDQEVAGYLKRANSFFLAWIRNAGHSIPCDQPRAVFDLIDRFISAS